MTVEGIDLYQLTSQDVVRYLPGKDCGECGEKVCQGLASRLASGQGVAAKCPHLDKDWADLMDRVCSLSIGLEVSDPMMRKVPEALIEINGPGTDSPVILTSSSVITVDILKRIMDASGLPAFIVPMDTKGYTVDNAVHEDAITQMAVMKAMSGSTLANRVSHRTLVIPGLAAGYKSMIERISRFNVVVGPTSGFELPFFIRSGFQ